MPGGRNLGHGAAGRVPAMRLHPRHHTVTTASHEIDTAIHEAWERHDLTNIEVLQILSAFQVRVLKFMLRSERHPDDPDKGGDEE